MRTLKKMLSVLLLLALSQIPIPAWGAENCTVTLPEFKVTVNGEEFDNSYSKYPLLLYKDITYFPLTYYDCRLLGLKTTWTMEDGLGISKNENYFYEYVRELNEQKNAKKQKAAIADGKITVNGTIIDNSNEEYPLLIFRDITYFPLTWRFAVKEFGWQYSFDHENGLIINNNDVQLVNPERWSEQSTGYNAPMYDFYEPFTVSDIYPRTGTYTKAMISGSSSAISFYNPTEYDVYINRLPSFQYRIYKVINNQNELVYWKLSPEYVGNLNSYSFITYDFGHDYLLSASLGTYRTELLLPDNCTYQRTPLNDLLLGEIKLWGPNFSNTSIIHLTK